MIEDLTILQETVRLHEIALNRVIDRLDRIEQLVAQVVEGAKGDTR
jgi:hypothetical protein